MPHTADPTSVFSNLPPSAGANPTITVPAPMSNKFFWSIKPGGTQFQILAKNSELDYDTSWITNPAASVSPNAGNALVQLPNGFYVPESTGGGSFYGNL